MITGIPRNLVPATESTNKKEFRIFWALFRLIVPVLSKNGHFFKFYLGFRIEISTGTKHEILV